MRSTGTLLLGLLLAAVVIAQANEGEPIEDYFDTLMVNQQQQPMVQQSAADKRSCIKRGASCDHRPNDCCFNSNCRCNLWGTNCKCQRMGLFQKWGRRR